MSHDTWCEDRPVKHPLEQRLSQDQGSCLVRKPLKQPEGWKVGWKSRWPPNVPLVIFQNQLGGGLGLRWETKKDGDEFKAYGKPQLCKLEIIVILCQWDRIATDVPWQLHVLHVILIYFQVFYKIVQIFLDSMIVLQIGAGHAARRRPASYT